MLSGELDDVFAEIGFHDSHAFCLERGVEPDLLRQHRLRLRHQVGAGATADVGDIGVRVGRRPREVNMAAARLERFGEAGDVRVEVVDHAESRLVRALPERLHVGERLPGSGAVAVEPSRRPVESFLRVRVRELQARDLPETLRRLPELAHRGLPPDDPNGSPNPAPPPNRGWGTTLHPRARRYRQTAHGCVPRACQCAPNP